VAALWYGFGVLTSRGLAWQLAAFGLKAWHLVGFIRQARGLLAAAWLPLHG
jgi:hypothetical protein